MITTIFETYRKAYGGLPREVWMISFALFVNRFGTMVLPFLALYLTSELKFTEAAAGWVISVYGLGSVTGTYVGGRLTRPVGSIRLQIILLLLASPMYLVLPFCGTWTSLLTAIFFLSLFADGMRPANATSIAEYSTPEQKTRSYALQRMAVNLGITFGPAIGGFLSTVSFFWLFVADAVTTLGSALALIFFFGFHARRVERKEIPDVKAANSLPAIPEKKPSSDWLFLTFIGLLLATDIVFFQVHATYPLYLRDHYLLTRPMIGLIYAVNTVMVVAFEMILVNRVKTWPLILTIGWGCFFSCLGFGMMPLSPAIWFCVFSMMVVTLGEMLFMPLSSGWVAQRSEGGDTGTYMGWYIMTYSVAAVLAPALGGWIYGIDRDLLWYLALVIGVMVLGGFYLLDRRTRVSVKPN